MQPLRSVTPLHLAPKTLMRRGIRCNGVTDRNGFHPSFRMYDGLALFPPHTFGILSCSRYEPLHRYTSHPHATWCPFDAPRTALKPTRPEQARDLALVRLAHVPGDVA